jgi:hypothetical protein
MKGDFGKNHPLVKNEILLSQDSSTSEQVQIRYSRPLKTVKSAIRRLSATNGYTQPVHMNHSRCDLMANQFMSDRIVAEQATEA